MLSLAIPEKAWASCGKVGLAGSETSQMLGPGPPGASSFLLDREAF